MSAWPIAVAIGLGGAHAGLLGGAFRRRSVLAGLCAAIGLALVVVALAAGLPGATASAALAFAAVTIVIGTVLLAIGQAIWRLLGDAPEEGS